LAHFIGERGKLFGKNGLHAVGKRLIGLVMDFDEQAIRANRDGSAGKRQNFVALACAVAGIDKDRQVTALLDGGDDGEVERVAGKIGERSNASLAQHHIVITFGEDVFRGHQEFVERGGHTPFQENGLFGVAGALEEREILHVARSDLDNVRVLLDEVERFIVDGFRDDPETVSGADFRKNLQSCFTETLKTVRRSTGLVRAAPEEAGTGFFDAFGDRQALFLGFDGTGAGDKSHVLAANDDVAGRRGNSKDGVFFLGVAADQFVGFANGDAFDDAGEGFENAEVDCAPIASDTDGGSNRTGNGMRFEAEAFDALAHSTNLLLGSVRLHDNQHGWLPKYRSNLFGA
jgi:hypothetical protein